MTISATPILPSDDRALVALAEHWQVQGRRLALATVIETWGSAPRPVGSKLLVDDQGQFAGSVSGGCVEAAVITAALEAITDGQARDLRFGVADHQAWAVGLACGGEIAIRVEPLDPAALTRFQAEVAAHPPPQLVLVGAVHIAQALAAIARLAGWRVTVVDPRRAYLTEERFPEVDRQWLWPDEALVPPLLGPSTAVVVLAHDPKIDDPALIAALTGGAFYVGALGSRRTHAKRLDRLAAAGVAPALLGRISGPVGLKIGAVGPAEIALSILGEVTLALRGPKPGQGGPLPPQIGAVVLAAGQSRRMGRNKLLIPWQGKSLIERAVDQALAAGAASVVVVLGHQAAEVAERIKDRPVVLVFNPDHLSGMASSLQRGIAALPAACDGAVILLGDMPLVGAPLIRQLIDAFTMGPSPVIVAPGRPGHHGHPVLWHRGFFADFAMLTGDRGARDLLQRHAEAITWVTPADQAPWTDVDTPEALAGLEDRSAP